MDHLAERCTPELEQLAARVTELERRLTALELGNSALIQESISSTIAAGATDASATVLKAPQTVSPVAIVGRSLLGLAGAYLLRATFESGVAPRPAIVGLALLFAWGWLFLSARAAKRSATAGALYGITSALIIFPMLWENTVRFKFLPAMVTAAVLVAWFFSALLLVRKPAPAITLWVAALSVPASALALFVAMRDPFPFTMALIVSAALTEYVACRDWWPHLRIAMEAPLDLVLCVLALLATRPGGFPEEYKAVTIPGLLVLFTVPLLISVSTIAYRTILLHKQSGAWDMVQACVTFALALWAVFQFAGSTGISIFGSFGFLAAAICYLEAFLNTRIRSDPRNFSFYNVWAGALFLISSYLVMPLSVATPCLTLSIIVASALALRTGCLAFGLHGIVWLVAVESSSGLLAYAARLFAGSYPGFAPPLAWMVAISGVICALIFLHPALDRRGIALLRFFSVANAALLVGAFGIAGAVMAARDGNSPSAPRLAVIRTVVICVVTLALALVGSRRNRRELIWVAYLTIGLGTLKLLLEDLRRGSSISFALSLLAFGVLLAIIPRLMRKSELAAPE